MKKFLFLSVFILGCGASFNEEIQKIAVKQENLYLEDLDKWCINTRVSPDTKYIYETMPSPETYFVNVCKMKMNDCIEKYNDLFFKRVLETYTMTN